MRFKYVILVISSILGMAFSANAQIDDMPKMRELKGKELQGELTPLKHKKGLWGYVNSDKKFVIKPVFDEVCSYEGNVARVCSNGKWGVIGRNGLYVVLPMYTEIKEFSVDSLAIVNNPDSLDNVQYGLIDSRGEIRQNLVYSSIKPTNYGYLAMRNAKYSTIDKNGAILLDKYFDSVVALEDETSTDLFFKDGKWGIMKSGCNLLAHRWDDKLTPLSKPSADAPNLYLGTQQNRVGVVTSEGKQVAPCYYDDVKLHESGKYYITVRDGKYGALSLKMTEIVPPILNEQPIIGEQIYRVYDGENFWCANINGRIYFRVCADVYSATNYEEYVATTDYPEWAKTDIIENNLINHEAELADARTLCEIMAKREYDMSLAMYDPAIPKNTVLFYPSDDKQKYGVDTYSKFEAEEGDIKLGNLGSVQYSLKSSDSSLYFVSESSGKKHYISTDDKFVSLNEAFDKYNIKSGIEFYVKDYIKLSEDRFIVRVAFVGTDGLVEQELSNLPVSNDDLTLFQGIANAKDEVYGIFTFDMPSASAVSFAQLPMGDYKFFASLFGGFYTCSSQSVIADAKNSVKKYNRNGELEWEFLAGSNEVFYDFDETENYIYLCGYAKNDGVEQPVIVQLNKNGERKQTLTKDYPNSRFSGIKCANYLIYAKLEGKGAADIDSAYYPHFILADISDNMYVRPHCAWEDWGGNKIGGCGLIAANGKWIQSPIIDDEQMCTLYDWEFSRFNGDYLIVRYKGKYGVIDRLGEIVVSTKYDNIEYLDNPNYFKVSLSRKYGVIDASGRIIVPIENDYVGRMGEDIIVVKRDGVYGCYDANGRNVVPFEYQEIKEYVGGMARICFKGRYGFIDRNGEILVAPFSDSVENFSDSCACVTIKNRVGFVTLQGDWIVPPMYDSGASFFGGLAPVGRDGKYGYINKMGEPVIPMRYDFADVFNAKYKIARVKRSNKWGVVNMDGNDILPLNYDEVTICADGFIYVKKDGKCGIFSSSGNMIYPVECDDRMQYTSDTYLFKHGVTSVVVNGKRVMVDKCGNVIFKL